MKMIEFEEKVLHKILETLGKETILDIIFDTLDPDAPEIEQDKQVYATIEHLSYPSKRWNDKLKTEYIVRKHLCPKVTPSG